MTVEQWEKWVLDGWMEAHQDVLASHPLLDRSRLGHSCDRHGAGLGIVRAGGAFEKAWTSLDPMAQKFRRALKSRRPEAWSASQKAQKPHAGWSASDRWANWHVLAGDEVNAWNEAWMAEPEVLTTSVWLHRPQT